MKTHYNNGRFVGEKSVKWKGGKHLNSAGYVVIITNERNTKGIRKYQVEHRLVMEKYLGRKLQTHESVHHKNGIKTDNRLDNLELMVSWNHRGEVCCPHCRKHFLVP